LFSPVQVLLSFHLASCCLPVQVPRIYSCVVVVDNSFSLASAHVERMNTFRDEQLFTAMNTIEYLRAKVRDLTQRVETLEQWITRQAGGEEEDVDDDGDAYVAKQQQADTAKGLTPVFSSMDAVKKWQTTRATHPPAVPSALAQPSTLPVLDASSFPTD